MKDRLLILLYASLLAAEIFVFLDLTQFERRSGAMANESKTLMHKSQDILASMKVFNDQAKPFLTSFEWAIGRLEEIRSRKRLIAKEVDQIVIRKAELQAREDANNSLGSTISAVIRSIFDGFTLGEFAEEGVFTENKQALRFLENVSVQKASMQGEFEILKREFVTLGSEEEQICVTIRPNVLAYERLKKQEAELERQGQSLMVEANSLTEQSKHLKARMWFDCEVAGGVIAFFLIQWILNGRASRRESAV